MQVERDRRQEAEQAGQAQEQLAQARSKLKKLDKKLKTLTPEGLELGRQADKANAAKKALVTRHAQAQVNVGEAEERQRSSADTQVG